MALSYDITDQKNARAQILDQQRTLAMLEERERLARELHDGIGQIVAAAHLQVQSAIELLGKGETVRTGYCLQRLADVTQEAKDSIRTYLLGVKTVAPGGQALLSTLENYLMHFVLSLMHDYPAIIFIGVDLRKNQMLVLSGESSRLLTIEDLVTVIEKRPFQKDLQKINNL